MYGTTAYSIQVQDLEAAADADSDDEAKQETALSAAKKLQLLQRSLRTQARLAFQQVEAELTKQRMTQQDRLERRAEMMQPGVIQQMLLDAAEAVDTTQAMEMVDEHAEIDRDAYDMEDLQDIRDRPDTEGTAIVNNMSLSDDAAVTKSQEMNPAIGAACQMLLEVLVRSEAVPVEAVPCQECLNDETVPESKKEQLYLPGKLKQHLATAYHSPKSKFLRRYKTKGPCPFGCGTSFVGKELLHHVLTSVKQSDEHLLAAACAGVFARDFSTREGRQARTATRVVRGQALTTVTADPIAVPLAALLPTANI